MKPEGVYTRIHGLLTFYIVCKKLVLHHQEWDLAHSYLDLFMLSSYQISSISGSHYWSLLIPYALCAFPFIPRASFAYFLLTFPLRSWLFWAISISLWISQIPITYTFTQMKIHPWFLFLHLWITRLPQERQDQCTLHWFRITKKKFINGSLPKPLIFVHLYASWVRCNIMILAWIHQSLPGNTIILDSPNR